jgi:hypothetical protein
MGQISTQISNFYRFIVADIEASKIKPLTRFDFLIKGTVASILILIEKCAKAVFFLLATTFTCGISKYYRDCLFTNLRGIMVCSGAFSLAFVGALFPKTVNEEFLGFTDKDLDINTLSLPLPEIF